MTTLSDTPGPEKPLYRRHATMLAFLRAHARFFVVAGLFSRMNLALLALPLYMLQVFDWLSTRSVETLVLLSLITGWRCC